MPKLKLRRLFDIKTDHVSLVDKAANLRQFIIMKRKKGESDMEIVEVLQKVENSLNDLSSRIEKLEGGFEFTFDTAEIEKKGARFSKETLASLRSLKTSLDTLLGEFDGEENVSKEDLVSAVTKGIQESLKPKDEKKEDLEVKIAKAIADALKSIKE